MTTTIQRERLFEIAKYTQAPTRNRTGYQVEWARNTIKELIELDLVTVKFGSVVLTEKGKREIGYE